MRVDKFMVGAQLQRGKTGLNCLIDVMVYRRGEGFFLRPTEELPEDYSFHDISRMNIDTFFDETKKDKDNGASLGYQINRGFDEIPVTMLGSDALQDGCLLRINEVEDELFLDGETYEDNIYYARIATKLVKRDKKDEFRRPTEDDKEDYWDLHEDGAYIEADVIYFRSLRELQEKETGFNDKQREVFSAFASKLKESEVIQNELKGLVSELLTGLTAELEVAHG
ncbi:hypothetical protein ACTFR8_22505 [Bacillus cereus group sp. MYBK15-3]|uniref:hypothetical protein n=1 Tax=unclassified Bacillus cereus group TaxID=2750818 RepID=UPI003F79881B